MARKPRKDPSSDILQNFITASRKPNRQNIRTLNALLVELEHDLDVRTIVDNAEGIRLRKQLIDRARKKGIHL